MNATVGKSFSFHAAHQLPNHDGKCRDLHGHTYRVEVIANGQIITEDGHPKEGMVIDFGDLKSTYREHIEPLVDHKNLNDTVPVPTTTAENIAHWMFKIFREAHREVTAVRVWETPTSWAEVKHGDKIRP